MVNFIKRTLCVIMVMLLVFTCAPASNISKAKAALSAEQAVDIYYNNVSTWKINDRDYLFGSASYFFIDLDFDGVLELVTSWMTGTGYVSCTNFYKINGSSLKLIDSDYKDYSGLDLSFRGQPKLYKNKSTGKLYYWADDYLRNGWYENYLQEDFFHYDGSRIKQVPLFLEHNVCNENAGYEYDTIYWILDGTDRKVSKSEYDSFKTKFFKGYTDLNLVTKAVEGSEFSEASMSERKRLLVESYKAFKYDKTGGNKAKLGTTSKITATKTSSSVTLKWNKVSGATGYKIYQKTSNGWKTIATTTKLTYTIKSLKANTKYTFAIRAYVTKSGKTTFASKYKSLAVTTANSSSKPAQVKNVKATPTATTVKLTWSKVSGAKGYEVFSYNAKTKKYTSLGKITGTSYTVKKLKANTTYSYAVQAYKVSNKKNVYGKKSSIVKVTTLLAAPVVTISSTKTKAHLSWADIKGESGYAIYMATSKDGKYTHLANYKANSTKATKSNLKSGKTYYFKIRAYKKVSGKTTYGAYSAVKSVKIK